MNKRTLLTTVVLILSIGFAQGQFEQRYWIWGQGNTPGFLEFNATYTYPPGLTGPPIPAATPPQAPVPAMPSFSFQGPAIVTEPSTGELLFYSDGNELRDKNHQLIATGLGADISSAEPILINQVPECPFDSYYLFSNPRGAYLGNQQYGPITYRVYHPSTQVLTPAQNQPGINLPGSYGGQGVGEGMVIVPHAIDPFRSWLICRLEGTNQYTVYEISPSGISFQNVFTLGGTVQFAGNFAYTSQSYSDPSKAEIAFNFNSTSNTSEGIVFTCQFDATSGNLLPATYNVVQLVAKSAMGVPYDVEYSPSGRFLYFSAMGPSGLWQHDFSAGSTTILNPGNRPNCRAGGLQIGPDGALYHILDAGPDNWAVGPGVAALARIPDADSPVTPLTNPYDPSFSTLSNTFGAKLPEFVSGSTYSAGIFPTQDSICPGDSIELHLVVNPGQGVVSGVQWYESGNPMAGSNGFEVGISQAGTFSATIYFSETCFLVTEPFELNWRDSCNVASISMEAEPESPGFTIFPNPFEDRFFIETEGWVSFPLALDLYTMRGERIFSRTFSSIQMIDGIEVPPLASGNYILKVSDGLNQKFFRQVMKK